MDILTKEELKKIIINTVQGMGKVSKGEIEQVYEWCALQKTGFHMVQMLIDGQILVAEIKDNEPVFVFNKNKESEQN